jgi:hypothetical protein
MAPAENVAPQVVAAANEVAHGLFVVVEDVDVRELTGAKESDELGGIAAIGLDPPPWPSPGEHGRDDGAGDPERSDPPVEVVAGYPSLVARGHGAPFSLEPLEELANLS